MSKQPPEPTPEELEKYGKYVSDKPAAIVYKEGKPVSVKEPSKPKRPPEPIDEIRPSDVPPPSREVEPRRVIAKEELFPQLTRAIEREPERRREEEARKARIRELDIQKKQLDETLEIKPIIIGERKVRVTKPKRPRKKVFYDITDTRLDVEPYPYPTKPTRKPKVIEDIEKGWMRYETTMAQPSAFLREKAFQTLVSAEEAKLAGRDVEAGILMSKYVLMRTGAGFYEGLTLPIRPIALVGTVATTLRLVQPEFRKEVTTQIVADPTGFISEVTGGFLGGYIFGKGIQFAKTTYRTWEQARFEKKYPIEEFLPYEQEYITPQPTQVTDFRSLITEERAKPVVWEYRGARRPTIPVSQRVPLKAYPDPSKVELMGGKAISQLVGLEEVSRARTIIEPTWILGLRISDIGPTIMKPFPKTYPGIFGLLGATRAIREKKEKRVEKIAEEIIKESTEQVKIIRPTPRIKRRLREPTFPEYITEPIEEPFQEQPTLPGYIPITEPIVETITRGRVRQESKPITIKDIPEKPPFPFPMQVQLGPKPIKRLYWEVKKKKGRYRSFGLEIFGEKRAYPIRDPMELIKGVARTKKKRRSKKRKKS